MTESDPGAVPWGPSVASSSGLPAARTSERSGAVHRVTASRQWVQRVARSLAEVRRVPPAVVRRLSRDNLRRIRIMGAVMIGVSLLGIARMLTLTVDGPAATTWRTQVLLGHLAILGVSVVVVAVAPILERRAVSALAVTVLEWGVTVVLLGAGLYLAWVDLPFTGNITAFILACVLLGMLIVVPPTRAATAFLVAAVVGVLVLDAPGTPVAGVSADLNVVMAAAIGLMLALVRWNGEVRSLVQQLHIAEQRDALKRANARLSHTAAHDELTGLINRREANLLLERELLRQRRGGGPSTLLLLDLDHFKSINDRFGHPAGDALLEAVAEILRTRLRASDLSARWGGEEFLAVLLDTGLDEALPVAEELCRSIAEEPFDLGTAQARVTVSIGAAPLDAGIEDALAVAYRRVDDALYAAKEAGRDRVVIAAALSRELVGGTEPVSP